MAKTKFNIQDQFLNQARKERVRVTVTMRSGESLAGYLKSFDGFCLLIENGSDILLYKHAISSVTSADGAFRFTGGRELPARARQGLRHGGAGGHILEPGGGFSR